MGNKLYWCVRDNGSKGEWCAAANQSRPPDKAYFVQLMCGWIHVPPVESELRYPTCTGCQEAIINRTFETKEGVV